MSEGLLLTLKGEPDSLRGDTCHVGFPSSFDQTAGQYFLDCDQNKSQPPAVYLGALFFVSKVIT